MVKQQEKTEMLAKTFAKIHSLDNISEEGKRGRVNYDHRKWDIAAWGRCQWPPKHAI